MGGENNNSSISGIWVWKGQELAFDLCEDWAIDSGSYDWKKLDPKAEETKALVLSTGSGRAMTWRAASSTRARSSSKSPSPSWRSSNNVQLHSTESPLRLSSCAPSLTTDTNLGNKSLLGS